MASVEAMPPSRAGGRRPSPPTDRPTSPRRERGRGPPNRRDGGDSYKPAAKERPPTPPQRTEEQKQAAAKAEYEKLLTMRSGGTYIPPARLRALQAQITDKTSKEYQRMAWEALKKSINGLINKINVANIKHIVPELFSENLVRGRGLFCRSIMKAQAASLPFTPIYAAMAAIVNTKLPNVGELLVKRLVMQFRKAFKRNDKAVCLSSTTFLAHMVNQQVVNEVLAAQILLLLLKKPTDDSVEIAVGLTREVGQLLDELNPLIANAVFDQFRTILHEADIDKRTQYMIEVLFQVRKDKYKDNPAIKEELDLIEEDDQIKHLVELDGEIDVEDGLNIFKFDPEYEAHEEAYKKLKAEILGEASGSEDDDDDDESSEEEDEQEKAMEIKDQSNTDLVNLRRTIYLTIMSSMDPEECTHKLMKVKLPQGQEPEMPSMIIECCSQEKTYSKFYGLIGERFAKINRLWTDLFEQAFAKYYDTIHRYDTNKLRNIARFFGHMLGSDAIGWHVLSVIHLNEDETTSSSRIFIKILFQDLAEEMGLPKLTERMTKDEMLAPSLDGVFPRDSARNVRFSINYFTSIGLGALTEDMRTFLQDMPKPALPTLPAPAAENDDDSRSESGSSYTSSYTGSSYSRSRSRSRSRGRRRRSESGSRSRSRSRSRSYSDPRSRSRSYSRTPSRSRSRTPPRQQQQKKEGASRGAQDSAPRHRGRSYSRSASYSSSGSGSRSWSPPPRKKGRAASPPPPRRRRNSSSSYSRSRSASPPPERRDGAGAASGNNGRAAKPPPPPAAKASAGGAPRRRPRTRSASSGSRSPSRSASPPPSRRGGKETARDREAAPADRGGLPDRQRQTHGGGRGGGGGGRWGDGERNRPNERRRTRSASAEEGRDAERGGGNKRARVRY